MAALLLLSREKLVKFASLINDAGEPGCDRACAHDGGAAVSRSKNLQAVAVRETLDIGVVNPVFAKGMRVSFAFDA